ncbi:MAG: hypothetical protein M0P47_03750 [Bacteroidales bacterium]|jgi:hypothetical protein|nr:hypothetical protein [Bacteroidales bacterium]
MKALAVFLSFYIILLSGIPCVDVVRHYSVQKVELSQKSANDHQEDVDHCSPFCTCSCCQANFYVSGTSLLFPAEAIAFNYYENHRDFNSLDLFDFLIPPKSGFLPFTANDTQCLYHQRTL